MCDECTWHQKTFLGQSVYWHLAIKLYCISLATAVTRRWNGRRNESQHRKLTMEKKNLPPLIPGLEPEKFLSRVRRSTTAYKLQWIWLVWPCSFFRKLQTLGVVWEINQKSRSFRLKCRRQMHCSRQKHTKRHRQTGGQTDRHTQTDRGRGLTITYHVVLCFGYVLVDEDCWCLGLHKLNCITLDFKYRNSFSYLFFNPRPLRPFCCCWFCFVFWFFVVVILVFCLFCCLWRFDNNLPSCHRKCLYDYYFIYR